MNSVKFYASAPLTVPVFDLAGLYSDTKTIPDTTSTIPASCDRDIGSFSTIRESSTALTGIHPVYTAAVLAGMRDTPLNQSI